MKVRTYGALMGALLTIAGVESAEAADCNCAPPAPKHQTVQAAPKAQARSSYVYKDDGHAYAQSGYDYRSSSRVTESFVRRAAAPAVVYAAPPMARDDGFRLAPNDARIRYFRDEKVIYAPTPAAYPPPPQGYYPPPPPAYYPPPDYSQGGFEGGGYDQSAFQGGVGYGADLGGGGGGGMTAYLYDGSGGSDVPPNGGGVNLPPGYGPFYTGGWQGPLVPTGGGLGRK